MPGLEIHPKTRSTSCWSSTVMGTWRWPQGWLWSYLWRQPLKSTAPYTAKKSCKALKCSVNCCEMCRECVCATVESSGAQPNQCCPNQLCIVSPPTLQLHCVCSLFCCCFIAHTGLWFVESTVKCWAGCALESPPLPSVGITRPLTTTNPPLHWATLLYS